MKGFHCIFLLSFIFSSLSYGAPDENGSSIEKKFITIVSQAQKDNMKAKNDMQRGSIKIARDNLICDLIGGGSVSGWEGKIKYLGSGSSGKGVLYVEIAHGITLETTGGSFYEDDPLIEVNSNLFKKVSIMDVGDTVLFSGRFIKPSYANDICAKETSLVISNGLSEPEFSFKFTDVIKNEPTKEQIDKEQERIKLVEKSLAKACVFISKNDDKSARDSINSISLSNGKKVDKIDDESYKGIKDYFLSNKNLNEESCLEGASYLINYMMKDNN